MIRITAGPVTVDVSIIAKLQKCVINELKFEPSFVSVEYNIGSGAYSIKLSKVVQKPDCGAVIEDFAIENITSTQDDLDTAEVIQVDLDAKEVTINTENQWMAGSSLDVIIFAKHDSPTKTAELKITIDFKVKNSSESEKEGNSSS